MSIFYRVKNFFARKFSFVGHRFYPVEDTEEEVDSENLQPRKRHIPDGEESEGCSKKRSVLLEPNTPASMERRLKAPPVVTLDEEDDEVVCVDEVSQFSKADEVQFLLAKTTKSNNEDTSTASHRTSSTIRSGKITKRKHPKFSLPKYLQPKYIRQHYLSQYESLFNKPPPRASVQIRDTGHRIEERNQYAELLRVATGYDTPGLEGTTTIRSARTPQSSLRTFRYLSRPHFASSVLSDKETALMKNSCLSRISPEAGEPSQSETPRNSATSGPRMAASSSCMETPGPSSRQADIDSRPKKLPIADLDAEDDDLKGAVATSPLKATHNEDWIRNLLQSTSRSERERLRKIEEAKIVEELHRNNSDVLLKSVNESLRKSLKIEEVPEPEVEEEEEEEEEAPLPELTSQMEREIDGALRPAPPQQILVEAFNIPIKRKDMETLGSLNWLNDEVINYYFNMIMERGKQNNFPSVYTTNTFFYSTLKDKGYARVKRWTRKVDIFNHELMLIPVHLGCHWTLASIDMKKQKISYYDSMLGNNNDCLNALLSYLENEMADKKKGELNTEEWTLENVKDIPRQLNGSDCGMFTCKFAEYISRRAAISFSQSHMSFFRRLMVYEILHTKILSASRSGH